MNLKLELENNLHHVGPEGSFPLSLPLEFVNVANKCDDDSAYDGSRKGDQSDDSVT